MGRWIDRAVLTALTAFCLYVLFLSAFGSIAAACCMSFICCLMLISARSRKTEFSRMTRYQAQLLLEQWAYAPDDEAAGQVKALLEGKNGEIVYLPKHPSAVLSMSDIFSEWKKHRSAQRLIVCAPCPADGRARTFSASLRSPDVEIMDAPGLIALIRRSDLRPPRAARGRLLISHIRENILRLIHRRPWHKNVLAGLVLMLMYLITGSVWYLALSLAALFLGGVGVRSRA